MKYLRGATGWFRDMAFSLNGFNIRRIVRYCRISDTLFGIPNPLYGEELREVRLTTHYLPYPQLYREELVWRTGRVSNPKSQIPNPELRTPLTMSIAISILSCRILRLSCRAAQRSRAT